MGELTFAYDLVEPIVEEVGLSQDVRRRAEAIAGKWDMFHSYGEAPRTIAAASVYVAGLLENEKVTQSEVGAAAGCSAPSIREAYRRLLDVDDDLPSPPDPKERDPRAPAGPLVRLKRSLGLGGTDA